MKTKQLICSLLFVASLISATISNATHLVGGNISYEWISGNTYLVRVLLYRDCSGIPMTAPVTVIYESVSCSSFGNTATLTQVSGPVHISPICAASLSNSSCNGGT